MSNKDVRVSEMFERVKYMKKTLKCCDHKEDLAPVERLTYASSMSGLHQLYRCPVAGCRNSVFAPATPEVVEKFYEGIRDWKENSQ